MCVLLHLREPSESGGTVPSTAEPRRKARMAAARGDDYYDFLFKGIVRRSAH